MPPDKKSLRRQLRTVRRNLAVDYRRRSAELALRHALSGGLYLKGRRWGFYLPTDEEFNALPLLNRALHMGKSCFLPVVPHRPARPLRFALLDGAHDVTHNRYGIVEPHAKRLYGVRMLDVLFLPLVGFDAAGRRLGMGGGYYDATLAYLRHCRRWHRPLLIGLAFACQEVEALPSEPWDIRLDAILTEHGIKRFRVQ